MAGFKKSLSKRLKADAEEVAVVQIQDKYSTYPSNGLTPVKLATIFREADAGSISRQSELFEEMEEKDPHLYSQLQTRKTAVTGLDFEVIPFDGDDETDKTIAEFVAAELESIESFEDVMMDLLDAIGKGIAISEIIWDYEDGKTVVSDIKWCHQKRFFWDNDDRFKIITRAHPAGLIVPDNKFIVHRYKARSGHASRGGVLRVVAWMYLFKNYVLKDWVSFCEVFGMPLRLGKYNPSASEADKAALIEALIQIGTDAAGIIPDGTEIEFKEAAKVTSIDVYETLARYCDEQMSKAILGQTLTSDAGKGSYAQSKTHNEVRHDLTVADCKALAATLRRDLIRPLVLFNFGETKRIPYIRFDSEEAADLNETVDMYKKLSDIGLKIPTAHLYKKFSIPPPVDGEEVSTVPLPVNEPVTNKQLVLKSGMDRNTPQDAIDKLADTATAASALAYEKICEPILKIVGKDTPPDELMEMLQDEKLVSELALSMDSAELTDLLHRTMFFADLQGRMRKDG